MPPPPLFDVPFDVVVVGAGSAGCVAAIAAAEAGAGRVLLLERYGFLGGTSTQSLDTFYGFFTPGAAPRKVAGGIPDRVVDRLVAHGDAFLRPNTYGAGTGVTYNPEYLKLVWDELVAAAGVDVLLHTQLVDVEASSDAGYGLVLRTPAGLRRLTARRLLDVRRCAHAASLSRRAAGRGRKTEAAQTFTTTFRMCNVDLDAYERAGGKRMLQARMAAAVNDGTYALPRRHGSIHEMVQANCIATVAVRVPFASPFDPVALSRAEEEGRRQAFVYETFLRREVPGFVDARSSACRRPDRHPRIAPAARSYRLTREDCLRRPVRRRGDGLRRAHRGSPAERRGREETDWPIFPMAGL